MLTFKNWQESYNANRYLSPNKNTPIFIDNDDEKEERSNAELPPTDYNTVKDIHGNYEKAMNRRRSGSALDFDRFLNYLENEDVRSFRIGNSYVLGKVIDGIFFPSHFAPESLKEGVKLLKLLAKEKTALLITDDLVDMAMRCGFKFVQENIPTFFRDEIHSKTLLISSYSFVNQLHKIFKNYIS